MTSISSRFLPFYPGLDLITVVSKLFCEEKYPLHEVDAHLLLATDVSDDPVVSLPSTQVARLSAGLIREKEWKLALTEIMCGEEPVAIIKAKLQLAKVRDQLHCVLVVSDFKTTRSIGSLPYSLRRMSMVSLSDAIWSTVLDAIEHAAAPKQKLAG